MMNTMENPAALGQRYFIAEEDGLYCWRNTVRISGSWPCPILPLLFSKCELGKSWLSDVPGLPRDVMVSHGCEGRGKARSSSVEAALLGWRMPGKFVTVDLFLAAARWKAYFMKAIHCSVTRASQERDSMHMSAMLACLYELFYVYRIKCLLLMQSLITGLETMLSGCEPNSGGVIYFGILLWFSLLLTFF